jgi:ABC-type phosphate transport system substrate-binding protein
MRTRSHGFAAAAAVSVLAVWLIAGAPDARGQVPGADALAIVVHRANPVDAVTMGELRRIFMLETQTWPNGRKITVVLREKGQPERAEAIRIICGLSEPDFERHVLFQTFRGNVNRAPRSIQSPSGMLRFVFNTPGAIGYVRADEVNDTVNVLPIDGRLPGDAKYPLRRAGRLGKVEPVW